MVKNENNNLQNKYISESKSTIKKRKALQIINEVNDTISQLQQRITDERLDKQYDHENNKLMEVKLNKLIQEYNKRLFNEKQHKEGHYELS